MRISDWSSDVCSSDLPPTICAFFGFSATARSVDSVAMSGYSFLCVDEGGVLFGAVEVDRLASSEMQADFGRLIRICRPMVSREAVGKAPDRHPHLRSEESREGKEWVTRGRSRGRPS